jgi:hypothetical protein
MLPYRPAPAPTGPVPPGPPLDIDQPLGGQVQHGLNLWLPLKAPVQMPALLNMIRSAQPDIDAALASLNYVHFARFLPSPDGSILWVITTYDGDLEPYIMDFVGVLGEAFTDILYFIKGAPPLPVSRYPRKFMDFIEAHNLPIPVWSAYRFLTVIDIEVLGGKT